MDGLHAHVQEVVLVVCTATLSPAHHRHHNLPIHPLLCWLFLSYNNYYMSTKTTCSGCDGWKDLPKLRSYNPQEQLSLSVSLLISLLHHHDPQTTSVVAHIHRTLTSPKFAHTLKEKRQACLCGSEGITATFTQRNHSHSPTTNKRIILRLFLCIQFA